MFESKWKKIVIYGVGVIVTSIVLGVLLNYVISRLSGGSGEGVFTKRAWFFVLVIFLVIVTFIILKSRDGIVKKHRNSVKEQEKEKVDANLETSTFMESEDRDENFPKVNGRDLHLVEETGVIVRAEVVKNSYEINIAKPAHSMVIGTTGSGKTTAFINPTIQILSMIKAAPSFLIADPKGELTSMHSKSLKERGYEIKVINLRNPFASIKWNPLEPLYEKYQEMLNIEKQIYCDEKRGAYVFNGKSYGRYKDALKATTVKKQTIYGDVYEDLHDIIAGLCPVTNTKEPIWESGAQNFALAIALAMLEDSENAKLGMTKEKYNFYNLTKIAISSERNCQYLKKYFEGRGPLSKAASLSRQILTAADNTRNSYLTTLYDRLGLFSDMGICSMTSANEITFSDMADKKIAVFLQIPDERETRHVLASLIVLQAYKELVAKANEESNLSLKRPVHFILDEFGNLPRIPKLEQMVTVGRSRNIWLTLVIQSYAQLKKVYEEQAAEIIKANCNIQVFIGTTDQNTVIDFSSRCGKYTIMKKSISLTSDNKEKVSESFALEERPLIYPSELQRLNRPGDMGNAIVTVFGYDPLKTKFTPSYECPFINCELAAEDEREERYFEEEKTYYEMKNRAKYTMFAVDSKLKTERDSIYTNKEQAVIPEMESLITLVSHILEDDEINELIYYVTTKQKTKLNKVLTKIKQRAKALDSENITDSISQALTLIS